MLGESRLKAHVGRLALASKVLFCFGLVAVLTHHLSIRHVSDWADPNTLPTRNTTTVAFVFNRRVLDLTDFIQLWLLGNYKAEGKSSS